MEEKYKVGNVVLLKEGHGTATSNVVRIIAAFHPVGGSYYVGERVWQDVEVPALRGEFNVFRDEISGHYLGAL